VAVRPTSRFDQGWMEWIANLDTEGFDRIRSLNYSARERDPTWT
jgi:hypothetical protein